MKFKKYLQNLFKKFFQKVFLISHGKIKNYEEWNINRFKKFKIDNITINKNNFVLDNYIYEIDNGRVYTDTVEQVAIIKDNFLIPNTSYQQVNGMLKGSEFNKALTIGTPRFIKKINGTTCTFKPSKLLENFQNRKNDHESRS